MRLGMGRLVVGDDEEDDEGPLSCREMESRHTKSQTTRARWLKRSTVSEGMSDGGGLLPALEEVEPGLLLLWLSRARLYVAISRHRRDMMLSDEVNRQ